MAKKQIIAPGLARGFISSQSPFALPPDVNALNQNVRLDDGVIRARYGGAIISATAGIGTTRGIFTCSMDGVLYVFAAVALAGKVSIYQSANAGLSFLNVSPTSGPYGDTRMTDTGLPFSFEVINDRAPLGQTAHDCLIIQNGVDQARVYAKANQNTVAGISGTFLMSVMAQPYQVSEQFSLKQNLKTAFISQVNLASVTATASAPTQFEFIPASYGTLPIAESSTGASGDTATATFSTIFNASGSPQIIIGFMFTSAITPITSLGRAARPEDFQIAFSDGTHTDIVWGSAGLTSTFYVDLGADTTLNQNHYYYMLVTVEDLPTVNTAAIASVILTLEQAHGVTVTSPDIIGQIGFIGASGSIQLGSNFKAALYSFDNRTVGPTFSFAQVNGGVQDGLYVGPSYNWNPPETFDDPRAYTAYQITLTAPNAGSGNVFKSYDGISIYIQELGQSNYWLALQLPVASYAAGVDPWTYNDVSDIISTVSEQDFNYPDPQSSCISMPVGSYIRNGSGRLLVASGSNYYYSDFNTCFIFYVAPITDPVTNQLDPNSGGSRLFSGEIVQCFVPLGAVAGESQDTGAPVTGVDSLYILTNFNLYLVGGYTSTALGQASAIGPHGTLSPGSVARNENRFYWLDDQKQVRVCQWGFARAIGVEVIDNYTLDIPVGRLPWVQGCALANRFFMAFSAPGATTNAQILVWSEIRNAWESLDVPAGYTCETMQTWYDQTNDAIRLMCTDNGSNAFRIVEHAQVGSATDPGSTGIALSVVSSVIHAGLSRNVSVREASVFADSGVGNYTINISRLALTLHGPWPSLDADANPSIGVIGVAQSGYTNALDQEGIGIMDAALQVTISGILPGLFGIYSATVEVGEQTSSRAARQ